MSKKFRLRNFMNKYPVLDRLRVKFLAGFCHHGIRFVDSSYRITKVISPGALKYIDGDAPCMFALYHGRMVGMLQLVPRHKVTVLVSLSRDGEIIARALQMLGYTLARGSPGRKAVEGTMQMVRAAEAGQHLAVMVDGPRGPIYSVKPGIIRLAELAGLPIVPFVCSSHSTWWFWGWDKFMGPLITTRVVYLVGDPIHVPKDVSDDEIEKLRRELEETMNHLRKMGEQYWNTVRGKKRDTLHLFHSPTTCTAGDGYEP